MSAIYFLRRPWLSSFALMCLALPMSVGWAQTASTPEQVKKILQERLPQAHIDKVQASQWPWLYEVVTDGELFYVDTTGDYLFYGKMLDTKNRVDLTDRRWNEINHVDFKSLPFNLALKLVKGDGSRKLVVFADPHCPYCVRFEQTLQTMTNITVYTFLLPLESLHPGATETARQIWCSNNRQGAWAEWMLSKTAPTAVANCKAEAFDSLLALGEKMKVSGTPTLFFEDGHRIPGAVDKEQLESEFKRLAANK